MLQIYTLDNKSSYKIYIFSLNIYIYFFANVRRKIIQTILKQKCNARRNEKFLKTAWWKSLIGIALEKKNGSRLIIHRCMRPDNVGMRANKKFDSQKRVHRCSNDQSLTKSWNIKSMVAFADARVISPIPLIRI